MTASTLEIVLEQARRLSPDEQVLLIRALRPTATVAISNVQSPVEDEDLAEQQATWTYLEQALDEDRPSGRQLFPQRLEQP